MQKHGKRLVAFAVLWLAAECGHGMEDRRLTGRTPARSARPSSQTFSEEIGTMDVAVIAKLVKVPPPSDKPGDEIAEGDVRGRAGHQGRRAGQSRARKFETLYFGDGTVGKIVPGDGHRPAEDDVVHAAAADRAGIKYLTEIIKLPKDGAERLVFFQKYLEDADEMLARDAYDEFARAPYAQVKAIKEQIESRAGRRLDQEPGNSRQPPAAVSGDARHLRRREEDLPMLEEFMKSSDRKAKSGLDALIACYLTLKGESGLPLVEELFLANEKADYADTYAAIMAIRFHGTEGGVIEQQAAGQVAASHARAAGAGRPGDSRSGQVGRLGRDGQAVRAV